eukprot:GGOE01013801.1.p1 GENE.GGOE01013801.1~~GGOE01013801.1.p1  ORF type:complete len:248 (+),score=69.72 GGOE01013801.1:35-745(+)
MSSKPSDNKPVTSNAKPAAAPATKAARPAEPAKEEETSAKKQKAETPEKAKPIATFETTMGKFKAEIFLQEMPITASNFIDLAKSGFYDGLHFHRVIPDFMAQFGCPYSRHTDRMQNAGVGAPEEDSEFKNLVTNETLTRDEEGQIPDEFTAKISNKSGTLAMANCGPNTGGSQFFINTANNTNLDWWDTTTKSQHPVFGKVIEGMDVVVKITKVSTKDDRPVTPIRMNKVTISGI